MITCGPVTLRRIEYADMELLRSLLNDPDIAKSVVDFGFPVSSQQQSEWFCNIRPHENAERFIIEAEGTSVGSLVVAKIDREHMICEVGYKIEQSHAGHGYATSAVRAALPYLFGQGFECVYACHLMTNTASGRVLEKAGFAFEGIRRQAVYRNGIRMDLWYWSVTRERFMQRKDDFTC
jgi:RimJ/RimL family protein N-acetyltransferase